MADIEKVLKGLEHCSEMNGENCSKCPYQNESLGYVPTCTGHLAYDALELLKEQQPKVIELLDLYDSEGMQGYIETRKSIRPCFLVHHRQYPAWCYKPGTPGVNLHKMGIMDTSSLKRFWEFRLYNKTWRIWTAKPTEEQRKTVPWETH